MIVFAPQACLKTVLPAIHAHRVQLIHTLQTTPLVAARPRPQLVRATNTFIVMVQIQTDVDVVPSTHRFLMTVGRTPTIGNVYPVPEEPIVPITHLYPP